MSQVDRIEVLRGPASSLYGADALGGVVQIYTPAPRHRVGVSLFETRLNAQFDSAEYDAAFSTVRFQALLRRVQQP